MKGILSTMIMLFLLTACEQKGEYVEFTDVTIYRDSWGVPHIHGVTDADAIYGLAWVTCEDDFVTLQEQMLALKGLLGEVKGKEGVVVDFAIQFMGLLDKAREDYNLLDEKTRSIVESYVAGINAYAANHRSKIIHKDLFPLTKYQVVAGSLLGAVEISGAAKDLQRIMDMSIQLDERSNFPKGSNAIAVSKRKSEDGETMLAINSHQPIEGWFSWYEAHLISDEGLNILGGTFPGGIIIFHGVNPYLGWAHTVNHADFSDIYRLEMHPTKSLMYKVDGAYKKLEPIKYRNWVKLNRLVSIPVTREVYQSDFGITFKTDVGWYAWRFSAIDAAPAIQQWYEMNRATSLQDFREALEIQGVTCTNIVYADREDNIMYISNGKIPKRVEGYNWTEVVPGTNSHLIWGEEYWPLDSLPQVLNPDCGYVFNTNNTPFWSADSLGSPKWEARYKKMGFQAPSLNNNRSIRLSKLLEDEEEVSFQEFKEIKFDRTYPTPLQQPHMINQELILQLDKNEYSDVADAIEILENWNRSTQPDNEEAPLFLFTVAELQAILERENLLKRGNKITEAQCVAAITKAKAHMLSTYGTLQYPLGDVQRHIRGDMDLPVGGGPDVLAAMYADSIGEGICRIHTGESFIQLVSWKDDGLPQIETINAFGSSADPESPHYTDQMEMYVNQQLKSMSLSLEDAKDNAESAYHPLIFTIEEDQ